jgi:methionyl-tRNA formyltransferase
MRIAFAGTPDFAAAALRALIAAGHEVVLVLTQPDRPAGRGMRLQPSAVKTVATAHGLPLAQPRSLRLDGKYPDDAAAARQALQDAAPELTVVAAYGLILPRWVLDLPPRGCLNIHGSVLPRWRGAAPIHRAIEAGDELTGITIMQMDEGLDTGDMLLVETTPITADDTTATLHDKLAAQGARLIVQALAAQALPRRPQPQEGITYAHKIDKAEAAIDWSLPAAVIERRVRAFDPFPGATFEAHGETVKLWRAEVLPGNGRPGEVLAVSPERLVVACGDGALALRQVQRPGGRRIDAAAWLQSHPLQPGQLLNSAAGA